MDRPFRPLTRPRWWPASLLVATLLGGGAQARGQDLRFEAAEQLYALSEVLEGGGLWSQLFRNGWPTDATHRRLTQELCGQGADALMAAYLGSGAGLPLSASAHQEARAQRQRTAGATPHALLRQELAAYKQLSGATFSVPQAFDPVAVPLHRARAELARPFDAGDLGTLRWKETPSPRHSLEALGFALLCEARYARLQLAHRRDGPTGKGKLWGATPEGGFFGLVAAHCAVAKLHELRRLIVDVRSEDFSPRDSLAGLEEFRYFLPSGWTAAPGRTGGVQPALLPGDERLKSHLQGLAAVLLGACELLALADPEGPKELQALFGDRAPDGLSVTLMEKDVHDQALELALFAFRSMRAFHVNVVQGRATSLGGPTTRGSTITPGDLGLFLMSLEAFRQRVRLAGRGADKHPRHADVQEEQRKADTLLRSLASASLREWDADEPGFYDLYSIAANSRQAQTKSLASQALAVRGLLATHRHVAPGGEASPFLAAAERTLRWVDRERWEAPARAFVERGGDGAAASKVSSLGAAATLGALRDMALTTKDGRYLTRYMQYLETLADRGLFRRAADRAAAGLAAEVAFAAN
ncbi:MAG: hypothetical protein M9894_39875 [Planctomycetes bacterium]|nr:hypothetical protein [Planctomycetota bacterium]